MADVVGYSRLMGENEAATLKILTTYQGIMDGLIRQHRGRVVDSPGDAVLAEFISVVDAVQCAVAVQKELQARNAELPENSRMQFRIGINLGDVIEEEEKIYGDGVNIAARLEALAEPGGICISKTAFDHIETKLPLGYEFLGEKTMKNITRPVGAYRVLLEPRVTVAGEIDKNKKQPTAWSIKAFVAAALIMFTAAISLAFWKSGFFSSQPAKQSAFPTPQSPLPPPTQVTPLPKVSPSPQAASPTTGVHIPKKDHQTTIAPLSKGASPTPIAPSTEAVPPIRDKGNSFFKNLDANNDGKVTLSEFMMWREVQFNHLDTNKDGSLSRLEVSAGKNKFARLLGRNFDLIDTNGDQMLSRAEFREAAKRRFLLMDRNRDGYLTQDELVEAQAGQE
jgi:adenylate cyclase